MLEKIKSALGGRKSETNVQFTFETKNEYFWHEYKRAKGHFLDYVLFKFKWNYFPRRIVPRFPMNLDIEASSRCNIKCDHCFRQYMDMKENEEMDFEVYRKIVEECGRNGLHTLKFSMRGEPTLHPMLPEMVALAKECGISEVWINTHGGNITEDLADRLMQAKPDWITVSFDGMGEMYESIRKPLKYEKSLARLKLLRKYRDIHSPGTILNVQTLWSAIKADPDAYIQVMEPIVDRISYNLDMNFKEIMLVPDDEYVCPRLWQRLSVTAKGDVLKCPSDFEKEEVLANIRDTTIQEVWDKQQADNRRLHQAGLKNQSKVCNKCHHGAKKVPKPVEVDKGQGERLQILYEKDFQGVGMNRPENGPQVVHQSTSAQSPSIRAAKAGGE